MLRCRRSGFAARHDIPLVHASPNVGLNLQDHLGINYFYRSHVSTLNDQFSSVFREVRAGLQYLLTRGGPLSISVNQSSGFFRSNSSRSRPNLQLYFQPASYGQKARPIIKLTVFGLQRWCVSMPSDQPGSRCDQSPDCKPPSIPKLFVWTMTSKN